MSLFGMGKALLKATKNVVLLPVAVAVDSVTMGGVLTDRHESHTASTAKKLGRNLQELEEETFGDED